jgi:hypothetical protein
MKWRYAQIQHTRCQKQLNRLAMTLCSRDSLLIETRPFRFALFSAFPIPTVPQAAHPGWSHMRCNPSTAPL